MALLKTTAGEIEQSELAKTTGFEERHDKFVVWIEYRFNGELVRRDCYQHPQTVIDDAGEIFTAQGMVSKELMSRKVVFEDRPTEFVTAIEWYRGEQMVKRDVHVIMKEASVVAEALVGGF